MTIHSEDVRRLLEADGDAILVLLEGRAEVIAGGDVEDEAHRGALQIISRAELLERVGNADDLSDTEVTEQAAILDAEVSQLGG